MGTHSQVSIVSNYIHEVCHTQTRMRVRHCIKFLLYLYNHIVVWLHGAVILMDFFACCHVLSRGNNIFHGKLWHFTCKISRVATCVYMCRNEIIIERYCNIDKIPQIRKISLLKISCVYIIPL